ncbi:MAG TPA: autotransporter outer membrane beta-barrel domain-containing protein, partial [Pseudoxanthomonas sp.]|nr:autotransporter outer membrane beta-barrel domain-containing protein [Pseudoxanthomonas sp.]
GEPDPTLDSDDEERGPVWANVNGVEANTQTGDGLVQLRSNSWRFQAGVDLARHRSDSGGVLRAGTFVQYGQADTDTQAVLNPARGNAEVTGYGLGVYATWFGDPDTMLGAYVDGWLQYSRFENEVDGSAGYHADYDASGWAASLEAGYAIALSKRIVLEPQLQYVRVNLETDGLIDSSHTQIVDLTRSDWVARVGARLYGVPDKPGGFSPFVEVNWWRRAGNASMQFNTDQVDHLMPKSLPTVDVGVQGNFGHGWNAWVRLGSDISDERYEEISGSLGLRFQW